MSHWMMDCREISQMVSEAMDRKLPLYQRMGIQVHVLMCRYCYRFQKQLLFLRKVIRLDNDAVEEVSSDGHMPREARKRIKENLIKHLAG